MAEIGTKNWYVVRAVSGQESKIKDHIMAEITRLGFKNEVEDILVPTEKVIQIRNGKKISKERVRQIETKALEKLKRSLLDISQQNKEFFV